MSLCWRPIKLVHSIFICVCMQTCFSFLFGKGWCSNLESARSTTIQTLLVALKCWCFSNHHDSQNSTCKPGMWFFSVYEREKRCGIHKVQTLFLIIWFKWINLLGNKSCALPHHTQPDQPFRLVMLGCLGQLRLNWSSPEGAPVAPVAEAAPGSGHCKDGIKTPLPHCPYPQVLHWVQFSWTKPKIFLLCLCYSLWYTCTLTQKKHVAILELRCSVPVP